MLRKTIILDNSENTLHIDPADNDGFHIREIEGKGKIYIYYSEIDNLIACLKRVKDAKGDR